MARVRTFIAVALSRNVKASLANLQEKLGAEGTDVRWTPMENFHLTLLFLGEVDRQEVASVCRVAQARARKHSAFTMDVEGLGGFPNNRRPKILWAGITDGAEELKLLHDDLEEGLLELNCYRREDRGYTPHLTLGRLTKSELVEDWAAILAKYPDWRGGTAPVNEVLVMSSDVQKKGPQYSVLGRAPLKS
jgi:2'-5' RNA ligase